MIERQAQEEQSRCKRGRDWQAGLRDLAVVTLAGSLDDLADHACPASHLLAHGVDLHFHGLVENAGKGFGDGLGGEDQMIENLGDAGPAAARSWSRRGGGRGSRIIGRAERLRRADSHPEETQRDESQKKKEQDEGSGFFHRRVMACGERVCLSKHKFWYPQVRQVVG